MSFTDSKLEPSLDDAAAKKLVELSTLLPQAVFVQVTYPTPTGSHKVWRTPASGHTPEEVQLPFLKRRLDGEAFEMSRVSDKSLHGLLYRALQKRLLKDKALHGHEGSENNQSTRESSAATNVGLLPFMKKPRQPDGYCFWYNLLHACNPNWNNVMRNENGTPVNMSTQKFEEKESKRIAKEVMGAISDVEGAVGHEEEKEEMGNLAARVLEAGMVDVEDLDTIALKMNICIRATIDAEAPCLCIELSCSRRNKAVCHMYVCSSCRPTLYKGYPRGVLLNNTFSTGSAVWFLQPRSGTNRNDFFCNPWEVL